MPQNKTGQILIVFYDGECGLCQKSILFLSKIDKHYRLKFAPLNGETYSFYLKDNVADISTVIYYRNGEVFTKSDALIKILHDLGGIYYAIHIIQIFPKFLRDSLYQLIAKNRHLISCSIYTKDDRFLK
jgi:predicted DCC family thiol-disulfide oxidoreductase YuxK